MSLYNEVFTTEYSYQREFARADVGPALERAREAAERVEHIISQSVPRRVEMLPRERPDLDGIAEALYTAGQEAAYAELEVVARVPPWSEVGEPTRDVWRRVAEAALVVLTPGE